VRERRRVRREGRGGSLRESAKEYKRVCDKCTSLSLALVLLNFQKRSLFFLFFFSLSKLRFTCSRLVSGRVSECL